MSEIKAIETEYKGYRFRSRLEARWAVFFDSLGVRYEYEPEGFDLGNGDLYLPDFRVKCCGKRGCCNPQTSFDLWIEVKGHMTAKDARKIIRFSGFVEDESMPTRPVLILGDIPCPNSYPSSDDCEAYDKMLPDIRIYPFNYLTVDGDYFAAYPAADRYGHFYLWGDDSGYVQDDDKARVQKALENARRARFEHGETPRIRRHL